MADTTPFEALKPETLPQRLGALPALRNKIGDPASWRVREVGDGNLNLVFIVEGETGAAVVKQALPYVRLVGESWPLPVRRAFFEHLDDRSQDARDGPERQALRWETPQAVIVAKQLVSAVDEVNDHVVEECSRRRLI